LDALETMGNDAAPALPALIQVLSDPGADKYVRWSAARIISKLSGSDPEGKAVPALAKLTGEYSDLDVRLAAINALEHYGPVAKDAVPSLSNATKHGDADPRIAAMKALQAIGVAAAR